jgi:hypothetical protein
MRIGQALRIIASLLVGVPCLLVAAAMLLTINIAPWSDVIIVDAEGAPFPRFPTLGAEAIPFFVVGSAAGAVAVICARTVVVRPAVAASRSDVFVPRVVQLSATRSLP